MAGFFARFAIFAVACISGHKWTFSFIAYKDVWQYVFVLGTFKKIQRRVGNENVFKKGINILRSFSRYRDYSCPFSHLLCLI